MRDWGPNQVDSTRENALKIARDEAVSDIRE